MINEILKSTGDKNYKFFCKMFSMWSDVIFSKQIEINDESITEYFKDLFCFTRQYYGELEEFKVVKIGDSNNFYFRVKIYNTNWYSIVPVYKQNDKELHIQSGAGKDMLKFNYYLDGIRQRKCSKNSI